MGDLVQAHHIISQKRGGPHEWWNRKPIRLKKKEDIEEGLNPLEFIPRIACVALD